MGNMGKYESGGCPVKRNIISHYFKKYGINWVSQTKKQYKTSLNMDNMTITDDKVISNHFNTFFNSAVEKLAKKYHTQLKPYSYLTVLKQFKKLLLKPLTDLINLYFSTRVFPKIFKQGKLI